MNNNIGLGRNAIAEDVLVKILEYGNIDLKDAMEGISLTLNLEFYFEPENHLCTISSEYFVLDIQDRKLSLIFVQDELNAKLGYIEKYLQSFLARLHLFYYLLRYLNSVCKKETISKVQQDNHYGCLCQCILTGKYCEQYDLEALPNNFNIFTHSEDDFKSLAVFFGDLTVDKIQDPSQRYSHGNVSVVGKSILLDNERSQVASLAFLRGCTVEESVRMHKIFLK